MREYMRESMREYVREYICVNKPVHICVNMCVNMVVNMCVSMCVNLCCVNPFETIGDSGSKTSRNTSRKTSCEGSGDIFTAKLHLAAGLELSSPACGRENAPPRRSGLGAGTLLAFRRLQSCILLTQYRFKEAPPAVPDHSGAPLIGRADHLGARAPDWSCRSLGGARPRLVVAITRGRPRLKIRLPNLAAIFSIGDVPELKFRWDFLPGPGSRA